MPTSFEYIELILDLIEANDLEQSKVLIEEMYDQFPKEHNCITSVILHSIYSEIHVSKIDLVEKLLNFLDDLRTEYLIEIY